MSYDANYGACLSTTRDVSRTQPSSTSTPASSTRTSVSTQTASTSTSIETPSSSTSTSNLYYSITTRVQVQDYKYQVLHVLQLPIFTCNLCFLVTNVLLGQAPIYHKPGIKNDAQTLLTPASGISSRSSLLSSSKCNL